MLIHPPAANAGKFVDPDTTADGKSARPQCRCARCSTLWFNTGTLCNLTCANCYIESSPRNDRLAYLEAADVVAYLDEIETLKLPTAEIGFTGGEPFMNPSIVELLTASLERGYRTLVLTNAMRPMTKHADALLALRSRFGNRLVLRVSVDHHRRELHEEERGRHTWLPTLRGLKWLSNNGFALNVAGRLRWGDAEASMREGFAALFAREGIALNANDPGRTRAVSRDGSERERSGNHHRVLGHSAQATGRRDVRVVADGGQAQRRRGADGRFVHAAAVRPRPSTWVRGSPTR